MSSSMNTKLPRLLQNQGHGCIARKCILGFVLVFFNSSKSVIYAVRQQGKRERQLINLLNISGDRE